jgi:ketosteroid isomerase-like protein
MSYTSEPKEKPEGGSMKQLLILTACLIPLLFGCSPAVPPHEPTAVVRALITAVNRGQVDVASSYFSDDAQIITAFGQPKGKAKIRNFMANEIAMKEHDDIIDLAADGANVTGTMKILNKALQDNSKETFGKKADPVPLTLKAVVQDGKITS